MDAPTFDQAAMRHAGRDECVGAFGPIEEGCELLCEAWPHRPDTPPALMQYVAHDLLGGAYAPPATLAEALDLVDAVRSRWAGLDEGTAA